MDTWDIGINSWVIMDGNYPDFHRGQTAKFAVSFWSHGTEFGNAEKWAERNEGSLYDANGCHLFTYQVNGQVVYHHEWVSKAYTMSSEGRRITFDHAQSVWVLDFGICAYQHSVSAIPPPAPTETFLATDLTLTIDQYDYVEYLHKLPGIPPLVYTWYIERITAWTAPLVETRDKAGHPRRELDRERAVSRDVQQTDARHDEGWYILRCRKLDVSPASMNRDEMQAFYAHY